MITAPFNFVPLNKEVFYPDWAETVSFDVPFEDGESGEIDIEITAHSPIFIRDHKDNENFLHHNNKEYIPSTSVKGVIRGIMDVIGYGKLDIFDKRLSYRDLNHPSYKKKAMNGDKIHMGWLTKEGKNWLVDDLGTVTASNSRIKYNEMKAFLNHNIVDKIKSKREAHEKYFVVKDRTLLDTPKGTIVFTGTVGKKKTREFLFPNKIKNRLIISKDIVETFKQAYYIGNVDENKNWKNLWSKEFKKRAKIPIFFQLNQANDIQHFGLSMLYKLPYENTLKDLVKNYQNYDENRADLSETIFGYINENSALKGRVQFSHFPIKHKVSLNKKAILPLSSPRATFFPSYIEQQSDNKGKTKNYKTYDNKDAVLRGFKFYPPQKMATFDEKICKSKPKVCTSFYPLDKGSIFTGKIRFFNLKKCELGALISSLTHVGNAQCYHKIGMGKPYGFGTVKMTLGAIKSYDGKIISASEMIEHFAYKLREDMKIDIYNDDRIKTLWALSTYTIPDKSLKYMELRDFAFAKKHFNKFCLIKSPKVLINQDTKSNKSSHVAVNEQEPVTISKTKMKKAITSYLEENFSIFYHQNQIKEFFSEAGFTTTPKEQASIYIEHKDNPEFIGLLKMVQAFNDDKLDEGLKERFYAKLTKKRLANVN